jgi:hypothetical protein
MKTLHSRLRGIYYALTKKAIPLHRGEQSQPFFIVGSGRCGTTLLRRVLQASEEIHIPPENWSLAYSIRHFDHNRWYLGWVQLADIVVSAHAHRSTRWFDEPPAKLVEELERWPESKKSLYQLIDRIYRYHGEIVNAKFSRWGDKTPLNIRHMRQIISVFNDAKFINMIRDGVDVAHSWSKLDKYAGDVVRPGRRWKNAVNSGREFARDHPESILNVRYERLVSEPRETTQEVCNFIGIKYEKNMLLSEKHYDNLRVAKEIPHYKNVFDSISTKSIKKGRKKMSIKNKKKLKNIINKDLEEMGYEKIKVE